jgi:hypothetical protein
MKESATMKLRLKLASVMEMKRCRYGLSPNQKYFIVMKLGKL